MEVDKIVLELRALSKRLNALIAEIEGATPAPARDREQSFAERDRLVAEGLCLVCKKPYQSSKIVRGCHEHCRNELKRGENAISDQEAVDAGLLLPADPGGRKSSPIKDAVLQARNSILKTKLEDAERVVSEASKKYKKK